MLSRVMVPMNRNAVVCVVLLTFFNVWNMVEQPITYLKEAEKYPLSVTLAYTPPESLGVQLACCVLAILPPLVLFLLFHTELTRGYQLSGGEVNETHDCRSGRLACVAAGILHALVYFC